MATRIRVDGSKYNQFFSIVLEDKEYVFHIYWNNALAKREFTKSGWYLSVHNSEEFVWEDLTDPNLDSLIQGGIKIMPLGDLFHTYNVPDFPKGHLLCMDSTPELGRLTDYQVGLDNFGIGKRFQLVYYTEAEYNRLLGG